MIINISDLIKVLEQRKVQLSKWTDQDRANERIDEIDCILDVDIDSLAKCGAEHAKKDETPVPNALEESDKSLEEAAEKQVNEALFKWSYDDEDGIEQYVYDAFIAGANWQKKPH